MRGEATEAGGAESIMFVARAFFCRLRPVLDHDAAKTSSSRKKMGSRVPSLRTFFLRRNSFIVQTLPGEPTL